MPLLTHASASQNLVPITRSQFRSPVLGHLLEFFRNLPEPASHFLTEFEVQDFMVEQFDTGGVLKAKTEHAWDLYED